MEKIAIFPLRNLKFCISSGFTNEIPSVSQFENSKGKSAYLPSSNRDVRMGKELCYSHLETPDYMYQLDFHIKNEISSISQFGNKKRKD